MRWSKLFIPTLRDPSADVLVRAAYLRSGGLRLPLGQRSLARIGNWLRAEMLSQGGQEMSSSGIRQIADAARGELRSYKQLPQLWFELNGGQFEAVGFGCGVEGLNRVLDRCGIAWMANASQYVSLSGNGEQPVAYCEDAGYCEPIETAQAIPKPPERPDPEQDLAPERFSTPGLRTIADLVAFTGLPAAMQIKSLVLAAEGKVYLALVRGDHQLSPEKFNAAVGAESRAATREEIVEAFGANPGSLGPVGVTRIPILADLALQGRRNLICGANEDDFHLCNVTPGRDFMAEIHDLRRVEEGDMCMNFPELVRIARVHELARVSYLTDMHVTDGRGQEEGLHVEILKADLDRILTAAAERHTDGDGLCWKPRTLAPFDVVITPVSVSDADVSGAALRIYEECVALGLDAILDDRDERPGVKFKDADLVGVPLRITIGKKLAQGLVELVTRSPKSSVDVPLAEAAQRAKAI